MQIFIELIAGHGGNDLITQKADATLRVTVKFRFQKLPADFFTLHAKTRC